MARRHIPESHTSHPNVTPLIDIMMCLIIFFMVVAKIGVTTGAEKMDIPSTVLGTNIKDMGNTLTLNVRSGILDEPLVTALVKGDIRPTELKLHDPATGQNQLLNTLKLYKSQNPQFKVIVRGEADMAYRFLQPVLTTCAEANVRNVDFNTKKVFSKK